MPPNLIGTAEACKILGVTKMTLSRWANDGTLAPAMRASEHPNAAYLFEREAVETLARKRAQAVA